MTFIQITSKLCLYNPPQDAGGKPGYCRKREQKETNLINLSQEPKKSQGYKVAIPAETMIRGRPSIAPNCATASRSSEISLKGTRLDGDVRDEVENKLRI